MSHITIPLPEKQQFRQRGVRATTTGTTLKVRLSRIGHKDLNAAAERLGMTASEFMRQAIESAAREVCNGEALRGNSEGD